MPPIKRQSVPPKNTHVGSVEGSKCIPGIKFKNEVIKSKQYRHPNFDTISKAYKTFLCAKENCITISLILKSAIVESLSSLKETNNASNTFRTFEPSNPSTITNVHGRFVYLDKIGNAKATKNTAIFVLLALNNKKRKANRTEA